MKLGLPRHRGEGLGLALVETVGLPTGEGGSFGGDPGATATTELVADYGAGGWRLALSAGLRARAAAEIAGEPLGSELLAAAAAVVPVRRGSVEALGTAQGRTALDTPFDARFTDALDLMGGVRVRVGRLAVTAAARTPTRTGWPTADGRPRRCPARSAR